jgi:hypothetical protein
MDRINEILPRNPRDLPAFGSGGSSGLSASDFDKLWGKLCAAHPRDEQNTLTIETYYEQLCGYPRDVLAEALGSCLRELKWFPKISEIVERIEYPRGCTHVIQLAEISSREAVLRETERRMRKEFDRLAQDTAALKAEELELFVRQRKQIEESGLPAAQAKLDAVRYEIIEQQKAIADNQKVLDVLKRRVKLLDQSRILLEGERKEGTNGPA